MLVFLQSCPAGLIIENLVGTYIIFQNCFYKALTTCFSCIVNFILIKIIVYCIYKLSTYKTESFSKLSASGIFLKYS